MKPDFEHTDWRVSRIAAPLAVLVIFIAVIAGCGGDPRRDEGSVAAALKAASAALVAHDAAAWNSSLPTDGTSARQASQQIYAGLVRFKWTRVFAEAVPDAGAQGRYSVTFHGQIAGSDSAPIVGERVLDFAWRQGRLTLVADRTEAWRRLGFYFAFRDPIVAVRPHLVVVGDRSQRRLISLIASCDGQAKRVVKALHLDPTSAAAGRKTVVYVCHSLGQAWLASDSRPDAEVYAYEVDGQIYALAGRSKHWEWYSRAYVRHELTHVYASKFGSGKHHVGLLIEGLAVAVEADFTFKDLHAELASGNRVLPLMKALTQENISEGRDLRTINLAYSEGGALVLYLEKRWGLRRTWAFADAVTGSDMTPTGIEQATRKSLGITWDRLYRGWKGFVRTAL